MKAAIRIQVLLLACIGAVGSMACGLGDSGEAIGAGGTRGVGGTGGAGIEAGALDATDSLLPDADAEAPAESGPEPPTSPVGPLTFRGPWAGKVTSLVESPIDSNKLFAIAGDRLFVSDDSGASWSGIDVPDSKATCVLPVPDGRLFVGTPKSIQMSSDDGSSWQVVSDGIESGMLFGIQVKGLAWEEGSPSRLWAGLGKYDAAPIWSKDDGSSTWTPSSNPPGWSSVNENAAVTDITVRRNTSANQTQVYATYELPFSAGGGVLCSQDGGNSFQSCSVGLPNVPYHSVSVYQDVVLIAGGHMYGSAYAGVYYSLDHGTSWNASTSGWSIPIASDVTRLAGGGYLAASFDGLMRTDSLSGTWTPVPSFDGLEVNSVLETSSGNLLAGLSVLGIQRSLDGTAWENVSKGIAMGKVRDAAVDPSATNRMIASLTTDNSGLVVQTETGTNGWAPLDSLEHPRFTFVSIETSGNWYVVSDGPTTISNDGLYVSRDEGDSFEFLGPLDGPNMDHQIVGLVEVQGDQHLTVAGKYFGSAMDPFVQTTTDGGKTWEELWRGQEGTVPSRLLQTQSGDVLLSIGGSGGGLLRIPIGGQPELLQAASVQGGIWDADVCFDHPEVMLVIGQPDPSVAVVTMLLSENGATTWAEVAGTATNAGEQIAKVAFHPFDCDRVFAATTNNRILLSEDRGENWIEMPDSNHLFAPEQMRVFRSSPTDGTLLLVGGGGIWGADLGPELTEN